MGYILSLEGITRVARDLGKNNEIVYTHGAYDLFHAAHLDFLQKSKQLGRILIVGVESDENISMYKNVTRPVIPLKERIEIVSKLDFADFTFPIQLVPAFFPVYNKNPHLYYLRLYKEIKPTLVTYGRKYSGKQTIKKARSKLKNIKFKRVLDKYGGKRSTTKIIDKILSSKI